MSLKQDVLSLLADVGKPVAARELIRRLNLPKDARQELKPALRELLSDGEILKIRGGRIGLASHMNLVVGKLNCNAGGFGFVVPEKRRPGQGDVYIQGVNMKEALHGDRVVARVERTTPKGAEGRIIRVLERGLTRLVGRYEDDGRFGGHVVPFDKRVLHEVFVPPADAMGAMAGQMVTVEITRPPSGTRNPYGRVLAVLGRLDDPGVDLAVIMAKYDLPDAFPAEVEEEASAVPKTLSEDDLKGRTDFRNWPTVTVDPETARDHDDAISLDTLANGRWKLGVHIADVAHYVRPGTLLDQEAYLRGTSVYFPDRVVPMLPHALSSDMCSLIDNVDRLTQTVVMELDEKGRVMNVEYHDGVIRSVGRMSYQQVQKCVDGDAEMRARFADLVPLFERMDTLAKLMRKRRYERGSLDFDLPEPKLVLNAAGEMTGITASARLDSMKMIEEFMLAANEAVAAGLSAAGAPSLYRVHEPPDLDRVEEFCDLVASLGYKIPTNLEEIRPQDFQLVLRQIEGKPEERLVSYLLLRTMKLARYHEENLGHFGLATDMYSHFTSPIRRYPDLVAHRALRGMRRRIEPDPELVVALPERAQHLSDMERRASDAERELVEWKKVRFMADKIGETFSGYITGVQSFGLFIELEEVFVQGLVHVSSMTDDYYAFDERAHTLTGENTGKAYRLGDKAAVQIARVDLERRQIDFVLKDILKRAAEGPPRDASRKPRAGGGTKHRAGAAAGRGGARARPASRPPRTGGRPKRRR